jgi:DNA (cytosine-5)-methyltransferase 1
MDHKKFVLENIDELADTLTSVYGTPDHDNKADPLDELIFILLSRRTKEAGYKKAYESLKHRFPTWEAVASASSKQLLGLIGSAGLGKKRLGEIKGNLLRIENDFGHFSLDRLKSWNNPRTFRYLTSLEGIGPKSAYCIMMYSLNRSVFPVDAHINRICQRCGIIPMGLDHKKGQALLADVFPKRLRYSLHVNLLCHGRDVCHPRNPACSKCSISGFCKFRRIASDSRGSVMFLDLFAGAGGMSLGFERQGFSLAAAVEANAKACATLLFNRPFLPSEKVINTSIETVSPDRFSRDGIELLVAGPPCQEFSKVRKNNFGNRGRNELYRQVLRFTKTLKPDFVVIENVPGMASHSNAIYVKRIERGLISMGYAVRSDMLNAQDYGVPQNRIRLFFIARRATPKSRKLAEESISRIWDSILSLKSHPKVSFQQGISGLPRLSPSQGANIQPHRQPRRISSYALRMRSEQGLLFNHVARKHNARDLEAYRVMREGENALDLFRKKPRLMVYSIEGFLTKYYKIRRNAPCPTIVAHLRKDANSYIHPIDNRGITPREAARIQSFPDGYRFLGGFGNQFEQIGNAVPPLLAETIANAILRESCADLCRKNKPT